MDFYRVLGISRYASESEAKNAYRAKVRATHPDTSGNPNSGIDFIKVQQAWEYVKSKGFTERPAKVKPAAKKTEYRPKPKKSDFDPFKTEDYAQPEKRPKPKTTPNEGPSVYRRRSHATTSVVPKSRYVKRESYTDDDLAWIALAINNLRRDAASVVIRSGYIATARSTAAASMIISELRKFNFPADEEEDLQVALLRSLEHHEVGNLLDSLISLANSFSSARDSYLFEYYLSKKHKKVG